ncbi:TolB family protein [Armatimonas sp.]|uniref:TolB family protein n=1 Tax=Armatimonas sp. TaxID=1872638 RepID=UPI003750EBD6
METSLGIFEDNGDIGNVVHSGEAHFDSNTGCYTITGSGKNMWAHQDTFRYLWRKAVGDITLSADVAFVGEGVEPHRKAGIVFRQSLNAESAYVSAVVHGDGLTSLQFRLTRGGPTQEVQAAVAAPKTIKLEKQGKYIRLYTDGAFSGAAVALELTEPFYIGLAVCSHNENVSETAIFSNVGRGVPAIPTNGPTALYSTLETIAIASTDRKVRLCQKAHFEAPNWLPDNSAWLYNAGGLIYKLPIRSDGEAEQIDTGFATRCNNDHGVTFDGQTLIISDQSQNGKSRIYTLPITGGTPRLITPNSPSYWHGVSPDGQTLAYCAQRGGQFDIYTIPITGGDETQLTNVPGLDDGPEFSPDGKYIYFNSERTGKMQAWRMRADGSQQEQLTFDTRNNWFPHVSPDGRKMAYLSYEPDVTGHPPGKDVALRLMDLETQNITTLACFYGGQGTINVNSWSPDSRQLAFVTYQNIPTT